MRGPGASDSFIDPEASSTIITGTVGSVVGAAAAMGLAPSRTLAASRARTVTTAGPRAERRGRLAPSEFSGDMGCPSRHLQVQTLRRYLHMQIGNANPSHRSRG